MPPHNSREGPSDMSDAATPTSIFPPRQFPPPTTIARLALSASGFVFDPVTGTSFNVNETGLSVLRALQEGLDDMSAITARLACDYDVPNVQLERDVMEFAARLREVFR